MLISNRTKLLIKTNFILGKRLTKRDHFSISIYILAGINSILLGFFYFTGGSPVFYITSIALLHIFIVNNLQLRHGIYINRYQLNLYPLSTRTILHFLWLNELIDLKILVFLIPVSICVVNLSLSQGVSALVYVIYTSAGYVSFCLVFVISKLLTKDFSWIEKLLFLTGWVLVVNILVIKDFASGWQYDAHDSGFDTLLVSASVIILLTVALYLCAYYLILREPVREVRSQEK